MTTVVVHSFKMAEQLDGGSGETLLTSCARKKRLQRKMTKDYYWIGAEENIEMILNREMILIALFCCLCLRDQLGLCSINRHTHMMTGNCSASLHASTQVIFSKGYKVTFDAMFWRPFP